MTTRYTPEQMETMAKALHYSGTDEFSDESASMLAQAAERLAAAEAIDHEAIANVVEEMLSDHPTATSYVEEKEDWANRLTSALSGEKHA